MKKLRKVVKLRIEDLYGRDMYFKLKKEKSKDISYHYVWNNRYFIGDTEVLRSRSYDNFDKKPLFCRSCDDYYLEDLISDITKNDNNIKDNISEDEWYLLYSKDDSKINYSGRHVKDIKKKIMMK